METAKLSLAAFRKVYQKYIRSSLGPVPAADAPVDRGDLAKRKAPARKAFPLVYGDISLVSKATGISRTTIHVGMSEVSARNGESVLGDELAIRVADASRLPRKSPVFCKPWTNLVEPTTRGAPESPLRWTCKSTRRLAAELQRQGYHVADRAVADLLHQMRYSLPANAKTIEGRLEHRMFSLITQNWPRRPLVSYEMIVNLIGNTKTQTGLRVQAKLSQKRYSTGIKVTDSELAKVNLRPASFHGEWNYSVLPHPS